MVHFLRDVGKVYTELPLLPRDLAIVILRPKGSDNAPQMDRQFRRRFRVRRRCVEAWLRHLADHHPGYRNFRLNQDVLSQLPEDASVFDDLDIQEIDQFGDLNEDAGPMDEDMREDPDACDEAAVPDVLIAQSELDQLRGAVEPRSGQVEVPIPLQPSDPRNAHQLSMPSIRNTPLNEFNHSHALLSLACPTLYPNGAADFVEPRQRSITYAEYIEHAMKWKDGRFAKHHQFRYVALNTLMRQQAATSSRYYVKKTNTMPLTKDQLMAALQDPETPEAQAILNRISRYASGLKGTRPFWYRRRKELESFAYCLGTPSVFITLSPADLHWESLYRHMPDFDRWKAAEELARMALSRRLLRENPHIAAWHFHSRSTLLRKMVLAQKFGLEDWWARFEWQMRGSSHIHGLYWFTRMITRDMDMDDEAQRERFARLWGYYITATNPKPNSIGQGGEGNPLSVDALTTSVSWTWLNSILNRCQRHHCSTKYCLTVNKKKAEEAAEKNLPPPVPECRFYYPKEPTDGPKLAKRHGRKWWHFEPERNDAFMNQYNPLITLCWLANTDISPCTSVQAVIDYAGKYCSKGEVASTTYAQISKAILPHVSDRNPMLSFVSKMMNKLVGERDYSAQEICHQLLGLPLQEDSRVVRSVDCRHPDVHVRHIDVEGDVEESASAYMKYLQRTPVMENLSYFEFLERWNFASRNPERWKVWQPPARPRVLSYFPRYKTKRDHAQFEDFCRVKLMLNHPHRRHEDLLTVNGRTFGTYKLAFTLCELTHDHADDHYGKAEAEDPEPEEDEFEGIREDLGDITIEDWQEIARMVPNIEPEVEPAELLGRRDLDVNYDWRAHLERFTHESFASGGY